MTLSYIERMEGAANVGAAALVFARPTLASAGRWFARHGADIGSDPRGSGGDRDRRDSAPESIEDILKIARSHIMRSLLSITAIAAGIALTLSAASVAFAQEPAGKFEVSLLGGVHAFNKNDTSLPDQLLGIPAVASGAYRITPNLAAEGEVTWFIPVKQSVDLVGGTQDRKAPNTLAYQAGLRGNLQLSTWSPYLAVGAGAMTFLSNSDSDRLPRLDKSQTVFAMNFGGGAQIGVTSRWGVRADFREFVGFPGDHTTGLSTNGTADPIWMERGTVGVDYRF